MVRFSHRGDPSVSGGYRDVWLRRQDACGVHVTLWLYKEAESYTEPEDGSNSATATGRSMPTTGSSWLAYNSGVDLIEATGNT